jgi:prevent-host-death family protein
MSFASFLDRPNNGVQSFAKNYLAVQFKLDYVRADGSLSNYVPDFIVRDTQARCGSSRRKGAKSSSSRGRWRGSASGVATPPQPPRRTADLHSDFSTSTRRVSRSIIPPRWLSSRRVHGVPAVTVAGALRSGYNDYMAKRPKSVGVRELKTHLSAYLDQVKHGAIIVVTERGRPVAELRSIEQPEDRLEAALRQMEAEGLVTRPTKRGGLTPFKPIKLPPGTPSIVEAISEDREDRF